MRTGIILFTLLFHSAFLFITTTTRASWPIFRSDLSRGGLSPHIGGDLAPLKWTVSNLLNIIGTPVTDSEGNVFVSSSKGLAKIDRDGRMIWITADLFPPTGSPVMDKAGNLYFANSGCNPYATSVDSRGKKRWVYDLREGKGQCGYNSAVGSITLSPDETTLYIGVGYPSSSIWAFNLDGSVRWKKSFDGHSPTSSIAIGPDGTLYFGAGDAYLYAVTPQGSLKWYTSTGSGYSPRVYSLVAGPDNNLYLTVSSSTGGDTIFSFDGNGSRRWKYQLTNTLITAAPALKGDTLYVPFKNNLLALDTKDGGRKWQWTATTPEKLTSPAVDKNGVSYTTGADQVYAVTPSGATQSVMTLAAPLKEVILGDNGQFYTYRNGTVGYQGFVYSFGSYTPPPLSYPVIFIPGIGGSELQASQDIIWSKDNGHGGTYSHAYAGGEKIWVNPGEAAMPGNDDYFDVLRLQSDGKTPEAPLSLNGNLTEFGYSNIDPFFASLGYEKGKNFFVFAYDWRRDIVESKENLDALIEEAKQRSGLSRVNIVAHSMGGLVARNYIADPEKASNVGKLISLGVPHLGAVKALKTLMYGTNLGYDFYVIKLGIPPSETKDLAFNNSSLYELLPSLSYFDFYNNLTPEQPYPFNDIRNIDNNINTGPLNYEQQKLLLSSLQYNMSVFSIAEQFHGNFRLSLLQNNNVKLYHIVGSAQPTLGQIIEGWWINWPGTYLPRQDEIYINGDDTVPLYSASLKSDSLDLSAEAKIYYVEQTHDKLTSQDGPGMELVRIILSEGDTMPVEVKTEKIYLEGDHLSVDEDAGLNLYDDSGNHTGPKDGEEIETNIPETFYSKTGQTTHIFIRKKASKVKAKVKAQSQKKVNMKLKKYRQDKIAKTATYRDLPVTEISKIEVDIDPGSENSPVVLIDNRTYLPTSEAEGTAASDQTPPATRMEISDTQPPTITLTATDDNSGVARIEYSLDNGETVLPYEGEFTIPLTGKVTILVMSTDNAGNEEMPQSREITVAVPTAVLSPTGEPTPAPTDIPQSSPTPSHTETPTPFPAASATPAADLYPFAPPVFPLRVLSLPTETPLSQTPLSATPIPAVSSLPDESKVLGVSARQTAAEPPILTIVSGGVVFFLLSLLQFFILRQNPGKKPGN